MSTFDAILRLEKHADGDDTWGAGMRQNLDVLGEVTAPSGVYFVSPTFSDANLHNASATDRRHFPTVQEAIDAGEAVGFGVGGYTIVVYPGVYNENLTITKSVAIAGLPMMGFYAGGGPTQIRGQDSVADSVVTVDPVDSSSVYLSFQNISFENTYDTTNATEITEPYWFDWLDQTTYGGSVNRCHFRNCAVRMQTWGAGPNKWTTGGRWKGWVQATFEDCQVQALNYGGGTGQGIVRRVLQIEGNNSQSKTGVLTLKNCYVNQESYDDGGEYCTVYADDLSQTWAYRCAFNQDVADAWVDGGTGSNTRFGLASGDAATYRNDFSFGLIRF